MSPSKKVGAKGKKIYVLRDMITATNETFLLGLGVDTNEKGEEEFLGLFGIVPEFWDGYMKTLIPADTIVEVSVEEAPVAGLIETVKYRPELYSTFLPAILSNSSPKKVSENLPADLLPTLTPEAEKKIAPEDLAELKKLYGL